MGTLLNVTLTWRDLTGKFQETKMQLAPGWHIVLLGNQNATKVVASNNR